MIKKLSPNSILTGIPNRIPKAYQILPEKAGNILPNLPTEMVRDFNQERTKTIIRMTFTQKRHTETLVNAESGDDEIC
jgi:hypothetical protein